MNRARQNLTGNNCALWVKIHSLMFIARCVVRFICNGTLLHKGGLSQSASHSKLSDWSSFSHQLGQDCICGSILQGAVVGAVEGAVLGV